MTAQVITAGSSRLARPRPWLAGALAAALALGAAAPCPASPQADAAPAETRAEHELSREQAVALVQQRYGARVVRADIADQNGRHLYVFRLLSPAGKVWIVRVDARSGAEVP
ncbi:MAG: PepSY domain-containing protein [Steroidobacterales bacterium]